MEKKITLIIPCYNIADTIKRTWDSLKAQSIGIDSLECIFVDDRSTDEHSWEKLQEIEKEFPESAKIIKLEENMRQGGARNVGITYASGKYLMFLDADDALDQNACRELYEMAEDLNTDIIQFRHLFIRADDDVAWMPTEAEMGEDRLYDLEKDETRQRFLIHSLGDCGCTNKFYRMDMIKAAGVKFAEHCFYEEPRFVYPLYFEAKRVLHIDKQYYHYYWHSGSTMTSKLGQHLLDHPRVQMELLEDLLAKPEDFMKYKVAIETHFLYSYYWETIAFSYTNGGLLPLDHFNAMQENIRVLFPDIIDNPIINSIEKIRPILHSVFVTINTQQQLEEFAEMAAKLMWSD